MLLSPPPPSLIFSIVHPPPFAGASAVGRLQVTRHARLTPLQLLKYLLEVGCKRMFGRAFTSSWLIEKA